MNIKLIAEKVPASLDLRRTLFFIFKIIIAILVVSLLVQKIQIENLLAALAQSFRMYILFALLILPLNLLLQFFKWRLVVSREKSGVPATTLWSSMFIGLSLGLVTPGRVGDFARTAFVKNVNKSGLLGLLLVDKTITLFVIYVLGLSSLTRFVNVLTQRTILGVVIGLGVIFLALLIFLQRRGFDFRMWKRGIITKWSFLERMVSGMEKASFGFMAQLFFITIVHVFIYCFQLFLLIRAFQPIALINALTASFAIMFTKSLLPVSFGDLGVREGAAVYFFGRFDVSAPAAFNASLLLFVINVLIPGITGLVILLLKRQINGPENKNE